MDTRTRIFDEAKTSLEDAQSQDVRITRQVVRDNVEHYIEVLQVTIASGEKKSLIEELYNIMSR